MNHYYQYLRVFAAVLLCALLQYCTRDIPVPVSVGKNTAPASILTNKSAGDAAKGQLVTQQETIRVAVQNYSKRLANSTDSSSTTSSLLAVCYDYYIVYYTNGVETGRDFWYTDCGGGGGSGGGGGGGGDGGSGGGGGGSGGGGGDGTNCRCQNPDGTTAPVSVRVIMSGPKINPAQETRCFSASQGAAVTVYVQQAVPNSPALNGGQHGVGHTFIGIEQNGITRYMGYYPQTGSNSALIALGRDYDGELRDNSGEVYDVSASTSVSGTQLSNILNYVNNFPSTYNLNGYNCADFGIAVGNMAGMNLPSTTTSAMLNMFNGRSPGVLGQDIRGMAPGAGVTVNTAGGTAPTKQGSCP